MNMDFVVLILVAVIFFGAVYLIHKAFFKKKAAEVKDFAGDAFDKAEEVAEKVADKVVEKLK